MMFLTDNALAQRVEAVEARVATQFAETHARLFPESGAAWEPIAGGAAVFDHPKSPMTQAVGLGMSGEVGSDEVDRLEEFYRKRHTAVAIELSPHADNSLREELANRNYKMIEQTNLLVRPLQRKDWEVKPFQGVIVRQATEKEFEELGRVITHGFLPEGEPVQLFLDLFSSFFNQSNATAFLAEYDNRMIGGGVMSIFDGVAALYATSTLREFRGRGAQTALIQARLNFGISHGCDLAMVSASPGTSSHRNLERNRFRIAYTRAKLLLDKDLKKEKRNKRK